jgi:hypothetical protein
VGEGVSEAGTEFERVGEEVIDPVRVCEGVPEDVWDSLDVSLKVLVIEGVREELEVTESLIEGVNEGL